MICSFEGSPATAHRSQADDEVGLRGQAHLRVSTGDQNDSAPGPPIARSTPSALFSMCGIRPAYCKLEFIRAPAPEPHEGNASRRCDISFGISPLGGESWRGVRTSQRMEPRTPRPPDRRTTLHLLGTCAAIVWTVVSPSVVQTQSPDSAPVAAPRLVYSAEVEAIIHPVSAEYMIQTIDRADEMHAVLVVFTLRTPGGLVDSTRAIVTRMLRATTPVAVFIAPSGARAASAGFILTMAADVAAMAPGTSMGAAHPVTADGQTQDETMAKKTAEDVAAYVRTLATSRHRNVVLAGEAVLNSRAFTEQEAVSASPPLVDLVATDLPDLLRKLDHRTIRRFDGSTTVLNTNGTEITTVEMSQRQRILSAIAHPNIAYLLLSLGMLGLTIELWSPGAILPGIVGAVSLLLAFFALQILPVNYAGLLLICLGLLLLGLEIKVTSYGLLTAGGAVGLVLGSMILVDSSLPELRVSLRVVLPIVMGFVGIAALLVRLGLSAQRTPTTTGAAGLIGLAGRTLSAVEPGTPGRVAVRGEIWRAVADHSIGAGARVQVTNVDGLTLTVREQ
jgi:membrane-bound serine protease (ClpP class)